TDTPNYEAYAKTFIHDIKIPGCDTPGRVFVGERADPFLVNVGEVFDLGSVDIRSVEDGSKPNILADDNVKSIEMELPVACLINAKPKDPVVGGWTSADYRKTINPLSGFGTGSDFTQVSRLSNPLVNEVIVGLKDKDKWGSSTPASFDPKVTL